MKGKNRRTMSMTPHLLGELPLSGRLHMTRLDHKPKVARHWISKIALRETHLIERR